ncbi:phosphate ABC transporter, permease protein PstA [Mangrovactinospora gilvigrisea]|uniref:Phosphate transport system permease protein PstA n=1 Tax=Mangrovactinospora gilvigrisea TaxID=1428644 RepID=A0A1J7BDZ2_9ACTN|nr:phosphate ABC transporter permease PstA [Mangrovactinospora gilvigrisea]OIV36891.1 phosphate ABC transporter, permease protein PstA [Mangrovactinospora gilvigrisea]
MSAAELTQDDFPREAAVPVRRLTQRRLPRWAPWLFLVVAAAVGSGIGAAAGLKSHLQWGLIAAAVFVVGQWAVSASVEGRRRATDRLALSLVGASFLLALVPLVAVLAYTISKGAGKLNGYFLTHSMNGVSALDNTGGVYHALIGTLEQVGIATLISVPVALLTAVYLVEYGRGKLAKAITFFVDVMTGIPSIVAGLFILSFWLLTLGFNYSGFAGALALAILMMPVVVRSTEDMLRLVPDELREASLALGVPRWRTILKVVLPTALSGITTGVMLAIARVAGETAPVLLLVFGNDRINNDPFSGPQSSLPLFVFEEYGKGNTFSTERAWAGALLLIIIVMLMNVAARVLARLKAPKNSR